MTGSALAAIRCAPTPPDWTLAACRRHDPDLWFPGAGAGDTPVRAKRICWTCPIVAVCREYAIPQADLGGIWGGLSPLERARARRERGV